MLGNTMGKKITAYVPDYVVFDLETTGISCASDEVIEISAVKVAGGQVVGEYAIRAVCDVPAVTFRWAYGLMMNALLR
jgi:DNA polymerase III alpha subunit (gram-positive type)